MPTFTQTDLLLLLLLTLATWRIACDYTQEHGPFGAYYWLRTRLKAFAERKIDQSAVNDPKDHPWYWLYDGADCFVCVTFWLAGLLVLLAALSHLIPSPSVAKIGITWFAVAGGARFTDALFTRIVRGKVQS